MLTLSLHSLALNSGLCKMLEVETLLVLSSVPSSSAPVALVSWFCRIRLRGELPMQTFVFQASISFGQRSWEILTEEWESKMGRGRRQGGIFKQVAVETAVGFWDTAEGGSWTIYPSPPICYWLGLLPGHTL